MEPYSHHEPPCSLRKCILYLSISPPSLLFPRACGVGLPSLDEGLSDEELALKIQAQEREDFALGRQDALITMVQGLAQSSTFKPGQYQASVSAICEAFRR